MPSLNRVLFGLGAVLGIAALVGVLIFVHTRAVSKYGNERYQAGQTDAYASIEHKAHEIEIKANALAAKLRERNDEENRRITAVGADMRLHGPGKAVCPGTIDAHAPASERVSASGTADAPVATVLNPGGPVLIALPFNDTIRFAEQCDANRAEVMARREQEGTK